MQKLKKISKDMRRELINFPEGTLRIAKRQASAQYYHCKAGAPQHGEYISKDDIELARQLAQKSYDEKVLRYAEKTISQIGRLLREYDDDRLEKIYKAEHPERRKLITPVEPTYEQQLANWMAQPYEGKGFPEGAPDIRTNQKIRVRSKSEKIMADYFESVGIIYKYEAPLYLKPYGVVYPDFTFLSRKTGKEIYWEHEGMMDHPDYAKSAVHKIELYEKNGIFPGENLILTFESSATILNSELVKTIVQKYLL